MMLIQTRQDVQGASDGRDVVATFAVLLTTAWIAVLLRAYTRVCIVKKFLLEDWLMLAALVSNPY